jgi:biotin carboxylase
MRDTSTLKRAQQRPFVLLISPHSSYRIAPYINAAQASDIDILVVSEGKHSLVSDVASGVHVEFKNPGRAFDEITRAVGNRVVSGVVGSDDSTVELAAKIAAHFGLVHNDSGASLLTRRKDLARKRLLDAGVPVPGFLRIDIHQPEQATEQLCYPCVVKPLALSGSRGVIRVNNQKELNAACKRIKKIIEADDTLDAEERQTVLVEEFISGPEVALEGMLHKGELTVLAIFDKPDPLEGPYFEETYYVTPSSFDQTLQDTVAKRVKQACDAYGLHEGPVHAELRIQNNDAWIMEVASRTIGGQCAKLLSFGTGQSLEQLVLTNAIGKPCLIESVEGGAGVLMIPIPRAGILRRVEGIMKAQKIPFIEDIEISIREGNELTPLPEGSSYLGFIFARAPDAQQVEQALRDAHACLNFVTAPAIQLEKGQVL